MHTGGGTGNGSTLRNRAGRLDEKWLIAIVGKRRGWNGNGKADSIGFLDSLETRLYHAFEIFFEGGISLCIYRVTEKLVDPIKCRKAFKEGGEGRGSRRAGRTGLDGAIN